MHLSARLRAPLSGLALCSAALLISACGGSSGSNSKIPTDAVAVVGAETVPKAKLNTLLAQVCVQYKAANKACPKPGTPERKTLMQGFVAQLVQQAEFDVAGKQLKVTVKQKDIDSSLQKLELQYAKGTNGKVDLAKWKKVLSDNHTSETNVLNNIKDGLLRQAIYVQLTKNAKIPDSAVTSYYAKNKQTYATPESRAIRHILVKDKALADKIYAQLATSDAKFATLAAKYTIDPGSKKKGGQLGTIQKGQTVPSFDKVAFSIPTGKVAKPVKSSYGWHVIEATADAVPASQRPLDNALKTQIRNNLLTQKKQTIANDWFKSFQKKIEKTVRYATGYAPAKTTSTGTSTASTAAATTSTPASTATSAQTTTG
jgi:foldase protein PrsA